MDKKSLALLLQGARELRDVRKGLIKPARRLKVDPEDPAAVRALLKVSQPQFARMLGVSVGTLRNWEQHRRSPTTSARILMRVAAKNPQAVLEAAVAR